MGRAVRNWHTRVEPVSGSGGTMDSEQPQGCSDPTGSPSTRSKFAGGGEFFERTRPTRPDTPTEQKRPPERGGLFCSDGAPGTIRTCDRLVRSQVLYPAELRAHCLITFAWPKSLIMWRRERDSNPRRAFNPYSLSRGALSTTQPSLRFVFLDVPTEALLRLTTLVMAPSQYLSSY